MQVNIYKYNVYPHYFQPNTQDKEECNDGDNHLDEDNDDDIVSVGPLETDTSTNGYLLGITNIATQKIEETTDASKKKKAYDILCKEIINLIILLALSLQNYALCRISRVYIARI